MFQSGFFSHRSASIWLGDLFSENWEDCNYNLVDFVNYHPFGRHDNGDGSCLRAAGLNISANNEEKGIAIQLHLR